MSAGLDPSEIGSAVRLHSVSRESAATKSLRLLVSGRVQVRRVDERGVVAEVRGDSGILRRVMFDPYSEAWSCDCEARGRCSHVRAVAAVVVVRVRGER